MKGKVDDGNLVTVAPCKPEDLSVGSTGPNVIAGKVENVEYGGHDSLIDVRVGEDSMVAAVDPATQAKVQEQLRLAVNPERLHFFDARTEAAI